MLVLVLAPDPATAESISSELRVDGQRVIAAVSAERALEVARRAAAELDVAIIDAQLGDEACRAAAAGIAKLARGARLVLVGEPTPSTRRRGAPDHVTRAGLVAHVRALAGAADGPQQPPK